MDVSGPNIIVGLDVIEAMEEKPIKGCQTMEHYFDLGLTFHQRYEHTHQQEELGSAIINYKNGLETSSTDKDLLGLLLNNLGLALLTQYQRLGNLKDLEEASFRHEEALDSCPTDHPDRHTFLSNLANVVQIRYKQLGEIKDLEKAIESHEKALDLHQLGHPDRSMSLNNLAAALLTRYQQLGKINDLQKAVNCHREVMDLCPPDDYLRSKFMNSFANALQVQYRQFGAIEDLDQAIVWNKKALDLCSLGHPDRSRFLNTLANALQTRYKQLGEIKDLQKAIICHQEALSLRLPGHPDRLMSLNYLASALLVRHRQLGKMKDLEDAIMWNEQALYLCLPSYPLRPTLLNNLASALQTRYKQLGEMKDLKKAIMWNEQALSLSLPGNPLRSTFLNNLANALKTRYKQTGDIKDLKKALIYHKQALYLCLAGHSLRSMSLNNLGNTLWDMYEQAGKIKDLEKAIICHEQALALRPPGHLGRPISLNNLAEALQTRFKLIGNIHDMEKAMMFHAQALNLRPQGHPDRTISLKNLGDIFQTRYEQLGIPGDLKSAIIYYKQAAFHEMSGLPDRLRAAKQWAISAHRQQLSSTISAYFLALNLQQQHLALLPSLLSQQRLIEKSSRLSLDAASYAIHAGKPELAVQFLEQGRSILWSKIQGYRQSLQEIAHKSPQLAKEFQAVSTRLEYNATSADVDVVVLQRALSEKWTILLGEIRKLDGLSNFMQGIPFRDLKNVSAEGPVIIVNISNFSSDAIILVFNRPLSTIALNNASPQVLRYLLGQLSKSTESSDYSRNAYQVLRHLWYAIVEPIVKQLLLLGIPEKSHIWWCPTSYLCALPIHAAGPYKKGSKNLPDLFVSSYTPTLKSLIRARSNIPKPQSLLSLLIISQPDDTIPYVFEEAKIVNGFQKQVYTCSGQDADKKNVLAALQSHSWVHFACHGHLEEQPFSSWFQLHQGESLTVLDLAKNQLSNAEFAFLSACHSASGSTHSTPDESIHFAAALQFSGFRSIIGTLWAMIDDDGPSITTEFHKYMFRNPATVDLKDAALALNIATRELRKQHVPLERWINFIHIGL
ncbi:CHAT domain-containing protein [Collybia nuda]|uniref:CHAT domain-containing protein n=1 Tax=Collybia nuda TaxID=64659 RepID=A0A9P5Y364_9AGAR|nr:CHAT domain-containing protein [Collybia nuda]